METQTETYDFEITNNNENYKPFSVIKWLRVYRADKSFYHIVKSIRKFQTREEAEQYKKKKEGVKEFTHVIKNSHTQ